MLSTTCNHISRNTLSPAVTALTLATAFFAASFHSSAQASDNQTATDHQLLVTTPTVSTAAKSVREGYRASPSARTDTARALAVKPDTSKRNHSGHLLHDYAEIWVADVDVHVFGDNDFDGFFRGFSVNLDVDVDWHAADVFAVFYLKTPDNDPQLLHSTLVFSIFERLVTDQYQVDVELVDNFEAEYYDLIIDIVDAHSLNVVDTISYETHRNLSGLPLESANFQVAINQDTHHQDHHYTSTTIEYETAITFPLSVHHNGHHSVDFGVSARVVEYGGATGLMSLAGLPLIGIMRRRRSGTRLIRQAPVYSPATLKHR